MDEQGRIRILPPKPGLCPACAGYHRQDEPHEKDSLYYQVRFYHENRRFPTWKDAITHCADKHGWITFDGRNVHAPNEECVLLYHVFQGTVADVYKSHLLTDMFTHWRPIPDDGWALSNERKPTEADADEMNCVLVQDSEGKYRVTGWHQLANNPYYVRWRRMPPQPADAADCRKKF